MLDKRALNQYFTESGITNKRSIEEVFDRLRREVSALAKIRHPSIVRIIEPLEESKGTMMFVTEQLTGSINSLIGESRRSSTLDTGDLDELVIQRGLLQVTEALMFLHQNAGFVHLDVQPSSVLVDSKGDWKIGGLGFIEKFESGSSGDFYLPSFDPRLPSFSQINLDYAAPELILDRKLDPSNDVFSLGCLILAIYTSHSPLSTNNNPSAYKNEVSSNAIQRALRSPSIPQYLNSVLPRLLTRNTMDRITLESLKQSEFFDNPLVRTVNFLDNFSARLPSEKKVFLTGLNNMLPQFPKSVLQRKILQGLLDDLGTDSGLVYGILRIILTIGNDMSQLGFSEKILPAIRRVEKEPGCQSAIVDFLNIFLSRLSSDEFKKYILPILMSMLTKQDTTVSADHEQQKEVLVKIKQIVEKLDFVTIKNEVYPPVAEIFGKTTSLAVKLQSLNAFHVLVEHELDKYVITEKLIPLLSKMKTREPDIIMAALNVYSSLTTIVDIDVLATSLIPQILALSLESSLTVEQFGELMQKVRKMLDKIEQDRKKRLARNLPQQGVPTGLNTGSSSFKNGPSRSAANEAPLDFNSLISGNSNSAGRYTSSTTDNLDDFGSLMSGSGPSSTIAPVSVRQTVSPLMPTNALSTTTNSSQSILLPTPSRSGAMALEPSRFTGSFGTTTAAPLQTAKPSSASSIDWSKATQKPTFGATNNSSHGGFQSGTASTSVGYTMTSSTSSSIPPLLPKPSTTNWGTPLQPQNKSLASSSSVNTKPGNGLDQYQSLL
ncbi:Scy1p [Sugiyamaella lignohabitans]|uniref:Scy1p n=1 Tax=Sugiyamaella lignohabitans TaxID=796027 RepID=A0A161HH82_9ASCO|nr:Scy1p [Sugiyamaella lignohabitans]ANB15290.1 Scy1p [Sugiyamaella lignohabitans]